MGWSRNKGIKKASEKVQKASESGGSWLVTPIVGEKKKKKEKFKKKKGIMLLGNEKEDKQDKFPQTNNCKQKLIKVSSPIKGERSKRGKGQ